MGDKEYYRGLRLWGENLLAPPVAAPANRRDENPEIRSRVKNISQILGKDEDINVTRRAPPPPRSAKKAAESKRKKVTPRKTSTSTGKRRKSSTDKTEDGVSSGRVDPDTTSSNSAEAEVAPVDERKTKAKPKLKSNKEKVNENAKLKNKKKVNENSKLKQGEATPTNKPGQFIGLYVCKEFGGEKTLGTVVSYEAEKKLYKIVYDNLKTEYTKQDEVLKIKATGKDIFEVRQLQQQGMVSKVPITNPED